MRLNRLFTILALGCLVLNACDDNEPSTANRGKTRPSVLSDLNSYTLHKYTFTLMPSSDAKYYGYVVLEGKGNEAPTAYDIVTSNVSVSNLLGSNVYALADNSRAEITMQCTFSEDYQVFTAGINENGLLSFVDSLNIHIADASPSTTIVEGLYQFNAVKYSNVVNPNAGEPFDVKITKLAGSSNKYVLYANWFNIAEKGYVCPPYLIGTVDYEKKIISFDGSRVNAAGEVQTDNAFGATFNDYTSTSRLGFWGGGDGHDPIEITFSDRGYLLSMSDMYISVNSITDGSRLAIFDGTVGNETFTFVK